MFQGRMMKRMLGSGVALFGVILMIGIGGAVESGAIGVGSAFLRMIIGCLLILGGAALFGGLE